MSKPRAHIWSFSRLLPPQWSSTPPRPTHSKLQGHYLYIRDFPDKHDVLNPQASQPLSPANCIRKLSNLICLTFSCSLRGGVKSAEESEVWMAHQVNSAIDFQTSGVTIFSLVKNAATGSSVIHSLIGEKNKSIASLLHFLSERLVYNVWSKSTYLKFNIYSF